jgi:hypothetical protein
MTSLRTILPHRNMGYVYICAIRPVLSRMINLPTQATYLNLPLVETHVPGCGLHVPAAAATVPRYDAFFLRTASFDVPAEGKSALALEMDDVRVLLRDATPRTLVMVDELGKAALCLAWLTNSMSHP